VNASLVGRAILASINIDTSRAYLRHEHENHL
jgi:hypothetical protein